MGGRTTRSFIIIIGTSPCVTLYITLISQFHTLYHLYTSSFTLFHNHLSFILLISQFHTTPLSPSASMPPSVSSRSGGKGRGEPLSQEGGASGSVWPQSGGEGREREPPSQEGGATGFVWPQSCGKRRERESLAVRREGPAGLGGHSLAVMGERESLAFRREGLPDLSFTHVPTQDMQYIQDTHHITQPEHDTQ